MGNRIPEGLADKQRQGTWFQLIMGPQIPSQPCHCTDLGVSSGAPLHHCSSTRQAPASVEVMQGQTIYVKRLGWCVVCSNHPTKDRVCPSITDLPSSPHHAAQMGFLISFSVHYFHCAFFFHLCRPYVAFLAVRDDGPGEGPASESASGSPASWLWH